MEIPLVRGPPVHRRDTRDQPRVAIVDERMADDLWPGRGSRRQARAHRRPRLEVAVDHGRRRRRARQAVHARHRLAHRDVLPAHAVSACAAMNIVLRSEPRRGVADRGGRRAPSRRSIPTCRCTRADDGRARGRVAGAAALRDAAAQRCSRRSHWAWRRRHLRRDGVSRQPGHARAGHPPRARRDARRGADADRPQRAWPWRSPASPSASLARCSPPASCAACCSASSPWIR